MPDLTAPCRACGAVDRYKNGRCRPCQRKHKKKDYQANRAARLEQCRRYYQEHSEEKRAYQTNYRRAKQSADPIAYARWQKENSRLYRERNREAVRERQRAQRANLPAEVKAERDAQRVVLFRQDESVAVGKSSPICRKVGFLLVLCADDVHYRAARADKPLAAGETALCSFSAGIYPGTWIINRATVVPTAHRALADRTYARLRKREGEPKNRTGRPSK